MERHQCLVYRCFFFLIQSRPQGAPVQQLFLSCLLHSRAYILSVRPVGVGVVSVTAKRPAIPDCVVGGRYKNPHDDDDDDALGVIKGLTDSGCG